MRWSRGQPLCKDLITVNRYCEIRKTIIEQMITFNPIYSQIELKKLQSKCEAMTREFAAEIQDMEEEDNHVLEMDSIHCVPSCRYSIIMIQQYVYSCACTMAWQRKLIKFSFCHNHANQLVKFCRRIKAFDDLLRLNARAVTATEKIKIRYTVKLINNIITMSCISVPSFKVKKYVMTSKRDHTSNLEPINLPKWRCE